jgi:hypothetical protein
VLASDSTPLTQENEAKKQRRWCIAV